MPFGNDPLGQSNSNTETLLAIWVSIFKPIVADILVSERLKSLGDLDPMIVDGIFRDVLRRILARLVRMERKGESTIARLDLLLRGRLDFG